MPASDHINHGLIPEKYHDFAWEATLQPHLDKEYVTKSGEPQINPGHLHFDSSGSPYIASSLCSGRHSCPPATKLMRQRIAFSRYMKYEN